LSCEYDSGANGGVKLRKLFLDDNMPFDKSLHHWLDAQMNDHLSHDQHRQGD
jgi:hypothetical protein